MPVTCLVTVPHANIKRKCQLEEGTLDALKNAIAASAVLAGNVSPEDRFQVLDTDFNDYVDLDDGDEVTNMSTIRVVRPCSPVLSNQEHGQSESMSLPGPSTAPQDDDSCTSGITEQGPCRTIVTPSRKFYSKVVSMFLQRYPFLADIIGTGDESWITSLKTKFKNERRNMHDDDRVTANRLKYATQKRGAEDRPDTELKRRKLHKDNVQNTNLMEGEDARSLQNHEDWLVKESKKDNPDEEQIDLRMASTMFQRTAALVRLPVAVSKEKYPYLMDSVRFFSEYSRRYGEHPLRGTQEAFERIEYLAIQGTLPCKQELREALLMDDVREDVGPRRKKHLRAVHCLQLLCSSVKEPQAIEHIFVKEDSPLPVTPCIRYAGDTVETAQHMHLYVDKTCLFRVIDLEDGIAAVLSSYWLFQIVYAPRPYNTLCTLERLCLKLSESRARAPAIKFMNKYKKQFG